MRELLDLLEKLSEHMTCPNGLVFRGHSDFNYKLVPTVFRHTEEWRYYDEDKLLKEFVRRHPESRAKHLNTLELLTYAQHYGLPTRLLDWSSNLLVAIYFACKENFEVDGEVIIYRHDHYSELETWKLDLYQKLSLANTSKDTFEHTANALRNQNVNYDADYSINDVCAEEWSRKINDEYDYSRLLAHPLRVTCKTGEVDPPIYENICTRPVFHKPLSLNERMIKQGGCFTIHGGKVLDNIEIIPTSGMENSLGASFTLFCKKVRVPASNKEKILNQLKLMGVDEASLFPELEYLTKSIKEQCMNYGATKLTSILDF